MSGQDPWSGPYERKGEGAVVAGQAARIGMMRDGMRQEQLLDRIDELTVLVRSVWELLGPHLGFTDTHLEAKMADVRAQLRDRSTIDDSPRHCPSCDAALGAGDTRCQWCGAHVGGSDPFHR